MNYIFKYPLKQLLITIFGSFNLIVFSLSNCSSIYVFALGKIQKNNNRLIK